MNTVALIGRLTKDIELKQTTTGKSVASFCIAVDRQGKDAGADFIDCVAWNKTAEFIERYFHKGNKIAIEGSIQSRTWDDPAGNKRKATEVLIRNVGFCESKISAENSANTAADPKPQEMPEQDMIDVNSDDLPF